jgi:hypothetical protein
MGRYLGQLSVMVVLVVAGSKRAPADIIAITQPTNTIQQFSGIGTLGYEFQTGAVPLTVTALGAWDEQAGTSSLLFAHAIAIWDTSGNQLTAPTTIPSGPGANQIGDYTYVSLPTPVVFAANTDYVIGVDQNNEFFHNSLFPSNSANWPVFNTPYITETERRADFGGGLVYPTGTFGGGSAWDAPNFLFTTGVPEPSAQMLLVIGVIISLGLRYRPKFALR